MKRPLLCGLLFAVAILAPICGCASAAPKAPHEISLPCSTGTFLFRQEGPRGSVYRGMYNQWPDSLLITNGKLAAVVVPQTSRIMYFCPVTGPNMIFENPKWFGKTKADLPPDSYEYQNFGGWKLWTKPWIGWPPPMDGLRGRGEINKDGSVTVVEEPSEKAGVQIVWTVGFDPSGDLSVDCKFINTSDSRKAYQIWSVIQTRADKGFWLLPATPDVKGYTLRPENPVGPDSIRVNNSIVAMRSEPKKSHWVGTNPDRGWVAYARPLDGGTALLVCKFMADRTWKYGDGVSTVVYNSPQDDEQPYTEIEAFSPIQEMMPGQEIYFTMHWQYVTTFVKANFAGDLAPLAAPVESATRP